jgi:3-oxo-5alpha-steroid 4-dehydrogenase
MDHIAVARAVAPPNIFAQGVMVNTDGRRFINEAAYAVNVGNAILEQPDAKAWLLLEARDFRTGLWKSLFPGKSMFLAWGAPALMNIFLGGTRRARSLERLARKLGANPAALVDQAREFNEIVEAGAPDPLGKLPELMHPLRQGPFYAVNMSLGNRFCPAMAFTVGGLVLDEETGAVKREDGSAIEGLYAAGRVGIGLPSNGYVSGLSLADTIFGGRRAARAIVATLHERATWSPSSTRTESRSSPGSAGTPRAPERPPHRSRR